jgi:hypothetical protein
MLACALILKKKYATVKALAERGRNIRLLVTESEVLYGEVYTLVRVPGMVPPLKHRGGVILR